METLSSRAARRVALAAQGFATRRPTSAADRRRLRRMFADVAVVQLDSVNVLTRSHYLPAWSRLGAYPTAALDRLAYRDRALFEYWAHEASLLPVELHPVLRWRMARARQGSEAWGWTTRLARERPDFVQRVLAEVRARGPVSAGELAEGQERRSGDWGWNWSAAKVALEWLFWTGEVTTAARVHFQRRYDLTERVLPPDVLNLPTPDEAEAHRRLLLLAARCLGVATGSDLADYFRLRAADAKPRLAELVAAGELQEVRVEGWQPVAYLVPGAVVPRRDPAPALLSPFDSMVWCRERVQRMFGVRFRLEIYVPAHRRQHGYYVLPFLSGGRLAARVDLKADRAQRVLSVHAAHLDDAGDAAAVAAELAAELVALTGWLDLDGVRVSSRGDLARQLRAAVAERA